jgi:hypothetical protein
VSYYFASWWAVIPGAFAILENRAKRKLNEVCTELREGTYPIPNPNNGAPDGDALNITPGA